MFRNRIPAGAFVACAAVALLNAPADAHPDGGYDRQDQGGYYRGGGDRYYDGRDGYRRGNGGHRGYEGRNGYRGGRWHREHCDRGTGGTIIGAIAGGLLGNTITGRGDHTVGTIVGAGAGALAGRAIDRDC